MAFLFEFQFKTYIYTSKKIKQLFKKHSFYKLMTKVFVSTFLLK